MQRIYVGIDLAAQPRSTAVAVLVEDGRCVLDEVALGAADQALVDTVTGARDAAVPYKVLLKFRRNKDPARMSKPCFGCNAVVGGEGVVRVGDRVEVKEWADGIGV